MTTTLARASAAAAMSAIAALRLAFGTIFNSAVIVSVICMIGGGGAIVAEAAIETNLQYKEYWYKTEQLCPDLQEAVAGKDLDTANLPYKSVFRFMDHLQSVSEPYADLPCILEANGPKRLVSTALIEAIHVDSRPWNYSGAETCEEHIKLRLPEPTFLKRSNVPKIICRIPKSRNGLKDATGSLYHPYVWQFQKGKLGLSFSSFNLSHAISQQNTPLQQLTNITTGATWGSGGGGGEEDDNPNEQASNKKDEFWLDPDPSGREFVQIVFTTRFGGMCTVRVQQYLVDPQKTLCGDIQTRSPFRLCGMYDCSEKENILRTLGFWTHRKVHDQLDSLMQANLPRWRREEPSYLEILVSTLRALVMPLLFLSVFYVTRRLRLKLASRQGIPGAQRGSRAGGDRSRSVLRQRQCYLRSLIREGSNNNNLNSSGSSDSGGSGEHMLRPSLILNHVVYDIPVGGEYPVYEDLPPPYESIVQPPSYHVATTQVKQASSPCPMVIVEGGGFAQPQNTLPPPNNNSPQHQSSTDGLPSVDRGTVESLSRGGEGAAISNFPPSVTNSPSHHITLSSNVVVPVSASQQSQHHNISNASGSREGVLGQDAVVQSPPLSEEHHPSNSPSLTPPPPPPAHPTV